MPEFRGVEKSGEEKVNDRGLEITETPNAATLIRSYKKRILYKQKETSWRGDSAKKKKKTGSDVREKKGSVIRVLQKGPGTALNKGRKHPRSRTNWGEGEKSALTISTYGKRTWRGTNLKKEEKKSVPTVRVGTGRGRENKTATH